MSVLSVAAMTGTYTPSPSTQLPQGREQVLVVAGSILDGNPSNHERERLRTLSTSPVLTATWASELRGLVQVSFFSLSGWTVLQEETVQT